MSTAPLARPGSPEYEAATHVFNLAAPVSPAAAVTARTVEEVRAALGHARAERMGVRMIVMRVVVVSWCRGRCHFQILPCSLYRTSRSRRPYPVLNA